MLIVLITSFAALIVCVGIHYQLFALLSSRLPKLRMFERQRVLFGIIGSIGAHLLEIGVFAAGMAFLHQLPPDWNVGDLVGAEARAGADYLYCSAMAYTTLGFENVTPVGSIRLMVGIEALVGLVLVAWSASFTFVQMQKYWKEHVPK